MQGRGRYGGPGRAEERVMNSPIRHANPALKRVCRGEIYSIEFLPNNPVNMTCLPVRTGCSEDRGWVRVWVT